MTRNLKEYQLRIINNASLLARKTYLEFFGLILNLLKQKQAQLT